MTSVFNPGGAGDNSSVSDVAREPANENLAAPSPFELDSIVAETAGELEKLQHEDGHIVFELESDATIPSEYIFLNHFLDELEPDIEAEIAEYLRSLQSERHGGWPLFHDGDFNISASVKAYYALKLVGDDPGAAHMMRAREAILHHGGAETANVFCRYALALFGQVPWRAVPAMPAELMLMPKWFPVNMWKILLLVTRGDCTLGDRGRSKAEGSQSQGDRLSGAVLHRAQCDQEMAHQSNRHQMGRVFPWPR